MSLPASGSLSISQVAAELGISASGLNLGRASVRNLAGAGGTISMSQLRGKSSVPSITIVAGVPPNPDHVGYANNANGQYGSANTTSVLGLSVNLIETYRPTRGFEVDITGDVLQNAFNWASCNGQTFYTSQVVSFIRFGSRTLFYWEGAGFVFSGGGTYTITFG